MIDPRFDCLDEKRAAEVLAVSVHTLRRWRHEKRGPNFVKFQGASREGRGAAGRVVYRSKDIAEFLDQNLVVTAETS